jgi:hypothetical protein
MTFNLDFDELGITIDKPVIELEYCELTLILIMPTFLIVSITIILLMNYRTSPIFGIRVN